MARLPVEFFDPTAKQRLLPNEDGPTRAEVIRIGLKVPYDDEEQIYRQVGQALERLLGRD